MRNRVGVFIVLLILLSLGLITRVSAQSTTYPVCTPTNTTTTTNYGFTKPGHCALNWDTTYNTDLDQIDSDMYDLEVTESGGGFPFILGSTPITSGGTFTSITDLTVNGVSLTDTGSSNLYLNQAGGYTTPSGSLYINGSAVSNPNFTNGDGIYFSNPTGSVVNASIIPPNANFVFVGTSINDDDSNSLSPAVTITGWTTTSGVTTVTNSGTNDFSAGEWISMRFATGWPSCPSGEALGTNCTLFQVLSTGLSSTQFEINTNAISAGSGSAGSVYSAMSYLPFATASSVNFPTGAEADTYVYIPDPVNIGGLVSGYSTYLHPLSPAVTGKPAYLIVNNNNNDAGSCVAAATTEGYYTTLFEDAHTDGYTVVIGTPTGTVWSQLTLGCSTAYTLQYDVDQWLRTQGKNSVLASSPTSTAYWDIASDLHSPLWDGSNTNNIVTSNSGLAPAGADIASRQLAGDIYLGTGTLQAADPTWYGTTNGSGLSGVDGILYTPFSSAGNAFCWQNQARTAYIMCLGDGQTMTAYGSTTFDGTMNLPGGGGGRIDTGGSLFLVGEINLSPTEGIHASSSNSNSTCWNTNGGETTCGASTGPTSATIVGTDSNGQLINASASSLSNNTTGTSGGLTGNPSITVGGITLNGAPSNTLLKADGTGYATLFSEVPPTGTAPTTTYGLSHTPLFIFGVYKNGQMMYPGSTYDYTVSGSDIMFNYETTTGDVIYVVYLY